MQKLWQMRMEWNESLDVTIRDEWNVILSDIQSYPLTGATSRKHLSEPTSQYTCSQTSSIKVYEAVAFL